MIYRQKRDLWALIRQLERSAEKDEKRYELTKPHAGHSETTPPKGIQGGDEGWGELFHLTGSAIASRDAAARLRKIMLRFDTLDPVKPKRHQLRISNKAIRGALRLVRRAK
jgi:hypothetical protein